MRIRDILVHDVPRTHSFVDRKTGETRDYTFPNASAFIEVEDRFGACVIGNSGFEVEQGAKARTALSAVDPTPSQPAQEATAAPLTASEPVPDPLPSDLTPIARAALAKAGVFTMADVAGKSDDELLAIKGVGPKVLDVLKGR